MPIWRQRNTSIGHGLLGDLADSLFFQFFQTHHSRNDCRFLCLKLLPKNSCSSNRGRGGTSLPLKGEIPGFSRHRTAQGVSKKGLESFQPVFDIHNSTSKWGKLSVLLSVDEWVPPFVAGESP